MDTRERLEAVRLRLSDMQIDERRFEASGPPCRDCIHYSRWLFDEEAKKDSVVAPYCRHIAFAEREFDLVHGQVKEKLKQSPAEARAEGGLCGPEALLFDPIPVHKAAFKRFHNSAAASPTYLLGGGALLVSVLSLFGLS